MNTAPQYPMFAALIEAPLTAQLTRWPNTLHAVDLESLIDGWESGTYVSACGRRGLRLQGMKRDGIIAGAPWPPRLKGMPEALVRCRDCWVATGKPRPRVEWL